MKAAFESIADPRAKHNRLYSLSSMLLALSAAFLCNHLNVLACAEWLADQSPAIKKALGFEAETGATPHQSTFQRLLKKLDIGAVEKALTTYFDPRGSGLLRERGRQSIAFDGKCQRGRLAFETQSGTPCHLLTAWCRELGQVLAQLPLQNKQAELTLAPQLLKQLDWQGRVLTGDAMFCQRNLCSEVVKAGGDYLFVVKGNQAEVAL